MRLKALLFLSLLPLTALVTGCGITATSPTDSVDVVGIKGLAHGGQQPVSGGTVTIYSVGTGGYGSTASVLPNCGGSPCVTTTNTDGTFYYPSLTCPQANTPVYILVTGGNINPSGTAKINNNSALGAGLGACGQLTSVNVNEITTVALAFAMAPYFTTTIGGTPGAADYFGGPGSGSTGSYVYSQGLVQANSFTIPTLVSVQVGVANSSFTNGSTTVTVDAAKITTMANILSSCVNSASTSSSLSIACSELFSYTTPSGGTAPTDTLQAAVEMALHPTQNVANIYLLSPPAATTPFTSPVLSATPNDWTIGVSYTTSTLGLQVKPSTVSTLDIDSTGMIWFPSNASGQAGVAYFDPTANAFNGPYNTGTQVYPQQVAIDANGYLWSNDTGSSSLFGYSTSSPSAISSNLSLAGYTSSTVSIGSDDRVNVGVYNTSTTDSSIATVAATRTKYSVETTTGTTNSFTGSLVSLASDFSGGVDVASYGLTGSLSHSYITSAAVLTKNTLTAASTNPGQDVFTGSGNFASTRFGASKDGLCLSGTTTSGSACYGDASTSTTYAPKGLAIDGVGNLWEAVSGNASVGLIPLTSGSYVTGGLAAPTYFLHGSSNGGTMTTPYGIAIDGSGNVWVSNAGCVTATCTPGSFTLSEIIGAAAPTIAPVSAQITSGSSLVATKPNY